MMLFYEDMNLNPFCFMISLKLFAMLPLLNASRFSNLFSRLAACTSASVSNDRKKVGGEKEPSDSRRTIVFSFLQINKRYII